MKIQHVGHLATIDFSYKTDDEKYAHFTMNSYDGMYVMFDSLEKLGEFIADLQEQYEKIVAG